jgi:hypothetical protein
MPELLTNIGDNSIKSSFSINFFEAALDIYYLDHGNNKHGIRCPSDIK